MIILRFKFGDCILKVKSGLRLGVIGRGKARWLWARTQWRRQGSSFEKGRLMKAALKTFSMAKISTEFVTHMHDVKDKSTKQSPANESPADDRSRDGTAWLREQGLDSEHTQINARKCLTRVVP